LAIYKKILRKNFVYLDDFGVNIYGNELSELIPKLTSQEHWKKSCTCSENKDSDLGLFSDTKGKRWSREHRILIFTAQKVMVKSKNALLFLWSNW